MRVFAAARQQPLYQPGQLHGRFKPTLAPFLCNGAGNPPRLSLAAEFPKDSRQLICIRFIYQFSRRQPLPRVHPHVEWAVVLKTEPTLGRVELRRTHAQVQQYSVATSRRHPIGQFPEGPLPNLESSRELRQPRPRRFNRSAIAITSIQPSLRRTRAQNGRRMSTPTDCPVRVTAPRLRI